MGRNFWCFACAENWARVKIKVGGGEGEGRKDLQTNPWILKTSVRQQTELVIGWATQTLLTSVDQRSQPSRCRKKWKTRSKLVYEKRYLQVLAERGFSRRFGI